MIVGKYVEAFSKALNLNVFELYRLSLRTYCYLIGFLKIGLLVIL